MSDGVNVSGNKYSLIATLNDGAQFDLTPAISDLSWADQRGEVAQRATVSLARAAVDGGGYLNERIGLCTQMSVFGNGAEVLCGIAWDWEYDQSNSKLITLTVYDRFIYAQKNKDNFYFGKNQKTATILSAICSRWGIKLDYQWETSYKHEKTIYRGSTLADCILKTLETARLRTMKKYVAIFDKDTLRITYPATNSDIYVFQDSTGLTHKMSMDSLVTRVVITGKEKKGKIPVVVHVEGDTSYGVLQELVAKGSMSQGKAMREARDILNERGAPSNSIQLPAPDIPSIRKGHRIKAVCGTLNGYYIVLGVTHSASSRMMVMEIEPE